MIPFSILDLSPIVEGATAAEAFRNTMDLAQHAEKWGYQRYWLAEHHNMPGIASAATSILIAQVAAATKTIRVGSGGIMLPNHAPLVIAEQFGTLASLFPGRIDLGLGRAPGTDMLTMRALRRDAAQKGEETFPRDVQELQHYFQAVVPGQKIRAVPGAGLDVPIWLLGSSLFSAQLAAQLGLPFAFASHFAPTDLLEAVKLYRELFKPSQQLERPYLMVAANVIAANTDEEARRLFTSVQQSFINLRRGIPTQLPPPIDNIDAYGGPIELANLRYTLARSFVGAPETVTAGLQSFLELTQPDELILTGHIYNHEARLHSFESLSEIRETLTVPGQSASVTTTAQAR